MKSEKIAELSSLAERLAGKYDPALILDDIVKIRDFSLNDIFTLWEGFVSQVKSGRLPELLSLYVHIPFCIRKCRYCIYYSRAPMDDGEIDAYLNCISHLAENFGNILSGLKFRNLYIGGGTPTILSENQMNRLLDSVFGNFNFDFKGEICCECSPATVTEGKIAILKSRGFNRMCMGIQTFSRKALINCNRDYQNKRQVSAAIKLINSFKFDLGLNVDLLAGLKGDTADSFIDTFASVAAEGPYSIIIYPLYPSAEYVNDFHDGSEDKLKMESSRFHADIKENIVRVAADAGYGSFGYVPTSVWQFSKNPYHKSSGPEIDGNNSPATGIQDRRTINNLFEGKHDDDILDEAIKFKRNRELHTYDDVSLLPYSLLGLGPTSRSHIFSIASYKTLATSFNGENWRHYRGGKTGMKFEMLRFVILSLRREALISRHHFKLEFGVEIEEVYATQIDIIEKSGSLERTGGFYKLVSKDPKDLLFCALLFAA